MVENPKSLMGHLVQLLQTLAANSQWIKAWEVLSLLRLQREQIFSTAIPLNQRFCIVGRAFVQALHAKILIFARRFRCQSFLQRGALTSPEQLSPTGWFVWYNRNQVIHKANFSLALQIYESAQRLSGGATYRSGCSQEHPNLKKIKNIYIFLS